MREKGRGNAPNDPTHIESDVKDQARMAPIPLNQLPRRRVPHPRRPIITRTNNPLRLLIVPQAPHQVRMPRERLHALPRVGVPQFDRLVVTARDEKVAARRPMDARETARVAGEGTEGLARVEVPELHEGVAGGGEDERAVKLDGVDGTAVAGKGAVEGAGRTVPDSGGGVLRVVERRVSQPLI